MHYPKQLPVIGLLKTGEAWTQLPLTTRGFGESKSHGHYTIMNQTVLESEKLKTDMVERKCLYIVFFSFKIHVYWL